jgi:hypothetical protein
MAYYATADFTWEEGFGTYGPIGYDPALITVAMSQGRWNGTTQGQTFALLAPLAGAGSASLLIGGNGGPSMTVPGNFAQAKGTVCFTVNQYDACIIKFGDIAGSPSSQVEICIDDGGRLYIARNGTLLATDTNILNLNATYWVAYDLTFSPTVGKATLWLNGVPTAIDGLTGLNTSQSGNSYFNRIGLVGRNSWGPSFPDADCTVDHLTGGCYLTAGNSDVPPLGNIVVLEQFPTGDASVTFTPTQIAGYIQPVDNATAAQAGNNLFLRQITAPCSGTVSDVLVNMTASSGASIVPCFYSDSANTPDTLLEYGAALVTLSPGVNAAPLSAGVSVVAGTKYWIGFLASAAWQPSTNANTTSATSGEAAQAYSATPPSTAPSMTYSSPDFNFWSPVASSGANYPQLSLNPSNGVFDYNSSDTVSAEDLFSFPPLPSWVTTIYNVGVGVAAGIDTSGARTFNIVSKSGATSSNGSKSGFSPGGSPNSVFYSEFPEDPNTSAAWTPSNLDSAEHGYEIAS